MFPKNTSPLGREHTVTGPNRRPLLWPQTAGLASQERFASHVNHVGISTVFRWVEQTGIQMQIRARESSKDETMAKDETRHRQTQGKLRNIKTTKKKNKSDQPNH